LPAVPLPSESLAKLAQGFVGGATGATLTGEGAMVSHGLTGEGVTGEGVGFTAVVAGGAGVGAGGAAVVAGGAPVVGSQ